MRNLVMLLDGTWVSASSNSASESKSNIYKLNLYIPTNVIIDGNSVEQIVIYQAGIGSATSGYRMLGGALAWGIERLIEQAYINICSNFDYNTRLYLFGFSRGSIVARALAGLISKCGILNAHKIDSYREIYRIYKSTDPISDSDQNFLDENCHSYDVNFLGVFDTVYGGIHRGPLYRKRLHFASEGLQLPSSVINGVQIHALDEDRFLFRPLPWGDFYPETQNLHQIWMPGVHGDIGGVFAEGGIGDAALLTMIRMVQLSKGNTLMFSEEGTPYGVDGMTVSDLERHVRNFNPNEFIVHSTPFMYNFLFPKRSRKISGKNYTLHPITKKFTNSIIKYKNENKRIRYSSDSLWNLNRDEIIQKSINDIFKDI